jgi:uncharacterized protein YraI
MKLARLAFCAGAFAIFSTTYAAAKPGYAVTTVNMRAGPATTNAIVTRIPTGTLIEVNNCTNGWCEVSWQDKNGFAIESALDTSGRVPTRPRTGPPVYSGPPVYYGPPAYYYGPGPYYYGYGPYWRRRHYYWGW